MIDERELAYMRLYRTSGVSMADMGPRSLFRAGWEACIQHEKDQLAKSLAEFDNDDNDCGDACKI